MGAPIYPTNRAIAMAAAGAPISLTLGVAMQALWVSGFAWLALVILLLIADAVLSVTGTVPDLRVQTPPPLQIGRTEKLTVQADFTGAPPKSVEFALGTSARIEVGPPILTGEPGAAYDFTLTPQRRGEAQVDMLWARWKGPLGLIWRQSSRIIDKDLPVLPNTRAAQEMAARLFSRSVDPGSTMQIETGDGAELNALKEFTTGSDRRMIDWKQSARHGSLLTREYRAERNTRVMLAIDSGRVMSEPVQNTPRIDHALTAALTLAYVALKGGDRVGLFSFDSLPRVASGMVSGQRAFADLQKLATTIDYSTEETNFTGSVTALLDKLERRSIVIMFTDFADTQSANLMIENMARIIGKHAVLFVAFRDEEIESRADAAPESTRDIARAMVAGAMMRERRAVFERLKQLGAHIVEVHPADASPPLLAHYLRLKREFA